MRGDWTFPVWVWAALALASIVFGLWRVLHPSPSQIEHDMDRLRYESSSRFDRLRIPQRAWGLFPIMVGISILARRVF